MSSVELRLDYVGDGLGLGMSVEPVVNVPIAIPVAQFVFARKIVNVVVVAEKFPIDAVSMIVLLALGIAEGVGSGVGVEPAADPGAGTGVARNAIELVNCVDPNDEDAYMYQFVGKGLGPTANTTPCRFGACDCVGIGKIICAVSPAGSAHWPVGLATGAGVLLVAALYEPVPPQPAAMTATRAMATKGRAADFLMLAR
jgi:hypothetical protein